MKYRRPTLPKGTQPRWETPDPEGIHGSYGYAVIAWARRQLGITFDPWQRYAIIQALRYGKGGNLLHRLALFSTARQNGKSVIVQSFFGWLLDEGRKILPFRTWTTLLAAAHDAKQARIVYAKVLRDLTGLERPGYRLTQLYGIEAGGLTLDTVSHIPGSARGLSAGAIAWDEMLTQTDWTMWEALSPTQSAQLSPIMLLTSTAGFDESVVLRAFYDRLVRQASGDEKPDPAFYGAWWQSEDPSAGLDWAQIRQANPSRRLPRDAMRAEYSILPPASWSRERLNHWQQTRVEGAFNPGVWARLRTPEPLAGVDPPYFLGVDIQPGWERATIAVAAVRPDGRIGAGVWQDLTAPITAESLIALIDAFPQPVSAVVYEAVSGAAAAFDRHGGEVWGVEWRGLRPNLAVAACMDVTEMILSGRLAVDDPLLDAQIPGLARRPVGQDGAFRFARSISTGPIDALMAVTFAASAAASAAPPPSIR